MRHCLWLAEKNRKWRNEIPSIPGSFFDDSANSTTELSDTALLLLMLGCVLTGAIAGFVSGIESSRPDSSIIGSTQSTGYQNGFDAGLASLPDSQARVLFRYNGTFNRSIAFTYPERNLSYECRFSRRTVENGGGEWAIDRQAFKYNGTVDCSAVQKDLIPEYSGANVSDTLLRNKVRTENQSEN